MSQFQAALTALADPTRRELFERVAVRPCSVGELAGQVPVSRPAVSQHLRVLKDAGLVVDQAVGTKRIYRINPDGVAMLRDYLDRFWRRSLLTFKSVAEETFMALNTTTDTSVTQAVDVAAPAEHVFDMFTMRMSSWWEPTHHLLQNTVDMVVEPFVGGTITDVNAEGDRCTWGRVLAFDPPTRFVFSWDISLEWQIQPDPDRCSEVHVSFVPISPMSTRVILEHRHLDRHGEGWESMRAAVGSSGGWMNGLVRLAAVAGSAGVAGDAGVAAGEQPA
jgi:DNA-binding transcriptional ArsR family regulator/uncharacterized protein YndB with AHSA1/START domain